MHCRHLAIAMKSFVFGLLLTGVLGIEVQQAIEFDNDDPTTVVTLTASNFDRKLKAGAPMLVIISYTNCHYDILCSLKRPT